MAADRNLMDKIVSLAKRRGFVFPGSEIYGGLAGTWDYGPLGVELKRAVVREWWQRFVIGREGMFGVESAILMNRRVWEASGHIGGFADPLIECLNCHRRFRPDEEWKEFEVTEKKVLKSGDVRWHWRRPKEAKCSHCGSTDFTLPRMFNLMFRTHAGPVEEEAAEVYLRPETAQGMFVNFKNVLDTMHPKLPFGIAQIGKAFRNEITPGNFIFRTREFEQMEIEYFIPPPSASGGGGEWENVFDYWLGEMREWITFLGLDPQHVHEREVPAEERAHYSKRTIDIDYNFPFGREELYGIAYRTDFDLAQHAKESGQNLLYFDEETKERFTPHVIEPTFGVDRTILALLCEHYTEDGERVVLKLPSRLAPVKVAVFPLLANKPDLVSKAREVYNKLREAVSRQLGAAVAWDDRGNIGKRYYAQDEIGTPWCVTVDHQTLEDDTVTVRDRDTMKQERVATNELVTYFREKLV